MAPVALQHAGDPGVGHLRTLSGPETGALRIEQVIRVAAPADVVWEVVTDLAAYPTWNPFVVACRSTLEVGAPISMRVRVLPWIAQPQRERITEHEPGRRLCYGVPDLPLGALGSTRCHEVRALGPATSEYTSRFELRGWIAPIARALLGGRLAIGFEAMTSAIGVRAEALHARDAA